MNRCEVGLKVQFQWFQFTWVWSKWGGWGLVGGWVQNPFKASGKNPTSDYGFSKIQSEMYSPSWVNFVYGVCKKQ